MSGRIVHGIRYRRTWRGRLIVQILVAERVMIGSWGAAWHERMLVWRDAKVEDLPALTIAEK